MKRNKKGKPEPKLRIKLQLDYKTVVIVNSKSSLKMWRDKYPAAKIIKR